MKKKLAILGSTVLLSIAFSSFTSFADYYTESMLLKNGMKNYEIKEMQSDLKQLGYFNYTPTGYFGYLTQKTVKNYQRDNSLLVDGLVGQSTAREIKIDMVLNTAKKLLGVPYVWGGVSTKGFDCSGFTQYVLQKNSISIPRTAQVQYTKGKWISKAQIRSGDLVFFETYKKGASHVGIYLGNNKFIHASSGAKKVTISDLNKSYYVAHYYGTKRIIN